MAAETCPTEKFIGFDRKHLEHPYVLIFDDGGASERASEEYKRIGAMRPDAQTRQTMNYAVTTKLAEEIATAGRFITADPVYSKFVVRASVATPSVTMDEPGRELLCALARDPRVIRIELNEAVSVQ
jgi:hypothetical protein